MELEHHPARVFSDVSAMFTCQKGDRAWWLSHQKLVCEIPRQQYLSGWWLGHPSEKYESQLGWLATQYFWENKKWQPNHQPAICTNSRCLSYNFLCYVWWLNLHENRTVIAVTTGSPEPFQTWVVGLAGHGHCKPICLNPSHKIDLDKWFISGW